MSIRSEQKTCLFTRIWRDADALAVFIYTVFDRTHGRAETDTESGISVGDGRLEIKETDMKQTGSDMIEMIEE